MVEVRDIDASATRDLRQRVLRNHIPGLPAEAPSDSYPETWHLGAFRDGALVGVVTGFPEEAPGHPGALAQRFRFMAVEPSAQGSGVGSTLIREVIDRARSRGDALLWANGRDTALDFYTGLGFETVGETFTDPVSLLPHHVVLLRL